VAALKVFVFDYASDDCACHAVPASLLHQGQMMLHALRDDLAQVPGVELVTLAGSSATGMAGLAGTPASFRYRFDASVRAADAVWPLAPQAGGMLERLSRHVLRRERILLGSKPLALRVARSKLRTSRLLAQAGIDVVPTYAPGAPRPDIPGAWVVKPDDGSDVDETRIFCTAEAAAEWIATQAASGYILQPFIPGKLGSLSLLCRDGLAQVLGCNEQRIAARDNQLYFLGTTVNSLQDNDGAFERLAQAVAAAMPGLWGHVGVDFVLAERGVVVLAVNARMTASYAGLHASIGCNPAAMVLDLLAQPAPVPRVRAKPVAVSVDVAAFGGF
jgi:predicted ATP-grasp superfamily ATP-dependent carboligase